MPPSPSLPKTEDPKKLKNAFRRPHSGQIDTPPYLPLTLPHETHTTPIYARLNGILLAEGWVVLQKIVFVGGFWQEKFFLRNQSRSPHLKQNFSRTAAASEKQWMDVFPLWQQFGVPALAVWATVIHPGCWIGGRCLPDPLAPKGKKTFGSKKVYPYQTCL